jgi:hypothetical protein
MGDMINAHKVLIGKHPEDFGIDKKILLLDLRK